MDKIVILWVQRNRPAGKKSGWKANHSFCILIMDADLATFANQGERGWKKKCEIFLLGLWWKRSERLLNSSYGNILII